MELSEIQCPSCFEYFDISLSGPTQGGEKVELDYDCEVCCRPMLVIVDEYGARAQSLDDL
ncbi:CPXCG motif-containing cysteine-rich protein [Rubritalea sp.]|uniref:CPXCG motif-containing cysteine-rich protein n=1 Tax=Rubritalea sp. TaxID=2109375 RepID=UPI003EF97456